MSLALYSFEAAAVTDRGRRRTANQDAFGYSVEHGVYLVSDGMGGAAAGEVASEIAIEAMLGALLEEGAPAAAEAQILSAVTAANAAIYRRAQSEPALEGMGTTLVGLVAEGSRMWVLNVGDSRCYLLRENVLRQCTRDHSLVEEQVRMGRMSEGEALRSPLRNVITRALGTRPEVEPDLVALDARPGDLFLLCSDGLTRELADAEIEAFLQSAGDCTQACASLVSAANRAGGHDNITALLVRVRA